MSMPTPRPTTADQAVRTLQIIHGAILMGAVAFAGVAVAMRPGNAVAVGDPWAMNTPLTLLAIALTPVLAVASFVVPAMISRARSRKGMQPTRNELIPGWEGWDPAAPQLWPLILSEHIVRIALLEGGLLFCLVAYMTERKLPTLVAAGALVALMAWLFPTEARIRQRVDSLRSM